MKKTLTALAIGTAAVFATAFVADTQDLLIPGVGIENYVTVNATTKNAILVKYGKGGTEQKHYSTQAGTGTKTLFSTELVYKQQGISFYFHPSSDTVFCIKARVPYKAKTEKGIVLGVSTMQDVVNAYGKTDWVFAGDEMLLEYPGIDFRVPFKGEFPVPQKVQDEALSKKVAVISIKGFEQ